MTKQLDAQIADLQSQLAFQEDIVQKLSDALYSQQKRMDGLEKQIEQLKNGVAKATDDESNRLSENEPPPHY